METALLNYFVFDNALRSTCDFNTNSLEQGISIYEVVRVENVVPLFLESHLSRFYESARLEGKAINLSQTEVKLGLKALIVENKLVFGNIKFLLQWDTSGAQRFLAWVMPFFYPSPEQYQSGVIVDVMQAERPNPNSKKALYELTAKADALIHERKCFEVVYLSKKGWITEGSRSNIFFIEGQQLVTPDLSMVLSGVTRAGVIQLANQNHLSVVEKKIDFTNLDKYSACFLTGTSPKILPVVSLHGLVFNVHHPIVRLIMAGYDRLCEKEQNKFVW